MADVEVTRAHDGGTVRVRPGDRVVLVLPQSGGTGYVWQLDDLPSSARVVDDDVDRSAAHRPGAAALRRLVVAIDEPGAHVIRASCRRTWEDGLDPQERFGVTVEAEA